MREIEFLLIFDHGFLNGFLNICGIFFVSFDVDDMFPLQFVGVYFLK